RSPVDAWLAALTDEVQVVDADAVELAELAEQLEEWRLAGERYAVHRTFRTCFRLHAPEEPAQEEREEHEESPDVEQGAPPAWRAEIMLQAKDDPSVLVAAEEVWSSNGSGLRALGRRIDDPEERLLGGLGHALRLWPGLEPALREPAPTGGDLGAQAAYRFLRDATPALEQAGFGVLVPAWWSRPLHLKLTA